MRKAIINLEITPEQIIYAKKNLANVKEAISCAGENLRHCHKKAAIHKDKIKAFSSTSLKYLKVNKNIDSFIRNSLQATIDDLKYSVDNALCHLKEEIPRLEKAMKYNVRQIPSLERALSDSILKYPLIKYNINDVKISLSNNPNIDIDTIKLIKGPFGDFEVAFEFIGVVATPDSIIYKNIMDKSWVLPDLYIRINLKTGNSTIKYKDMSLGKVYGYKKGKPHPQIMGGDNPCYGDFHQAIISAGESHDITEMVTVLQLWLETVNSVGDDAGQLYPRFMFSAGDGFSHDHLNIYNNCREYIILDKIIYCYKISDSQYIVPIVKGGVTTLYETKDSTVCIDLFDSVGKGELPDIKFLYDKPEPKKPEIAFNDDTFLDQLTAT